MRKSVIYEILIIILLVIASLFFIYRMNTNFVNEGKNVTSASKIKKELLDVDFMESNGLDLFKKYNIGFSQEEHQVKTKIGLLHFNYEHSKPSKMEFTSDPIIPKNIHVIWLGGNELPKNYQYFLETWRKFHPNWNIKVWNEDDLIKENFSSNDLYWKAESYAEKSDIMRYEVLYRYGGLYIDTDVECFANFDDLHHKYDFYINLDAPILNKGTIQLINSMIGASPNHPILQETIEKIRKDWDDTSTRFSKTFSSHSNKSWRSKHHLAIRRTMLPLSDVVFNFLWHQWKYKSGSQSKYRVIALPLGYNMPIYPIDTSYSYKKIIKDETRSIHHFDKSNSLMVNIDFTKSLFKEDVILDEDVDVFQSQRNIFLHFQDLFKDNFPTKISFEPNPQIPEAIYISNKNSLSEKEMLELQEKWEKLNPFFVVKSIDDEELLSYLPINIKLEDSELKKLIAKFYFLSKNGGVLVDTAFLPADLQEFNYKYKYYGLLNTVLNIEDLLYISDSMIASKANHVIIDSVLRDIEKEFFTYGSNVTVDKVMYVYMDSVYKYHLIDGKNILFPESIFNQKR